MKRKRMLLTLDKDLHATLMEFKAVTGIPASTFIACLLEELKPSFCDSIRIFKDARSTAAAQLQKISSLR